MIFQAAASLWSRLLGVVLAVCAAAWLTPAYAASDNAVGLILSVERYDSPSIAKLDFAANDAREMRSVMERVLGVPSSHFVPVVAPTFNSFQSIFGLDGGNRFDKSIDSDLKAMVRRVANGRTNGRVYVYLNAHGLPDRTAGTAVILPQDANPTSSRGYGIPLKEIEAALRDIKAELLPDGDVILFVEACFSGYTGAAGKQVMPNTSFAPTPIDDGPAADQTITVLRAAEGNQTAFWDRRKERGVFTEAILQGLSGLADREGDKSDGRITFQELTAFIRDVMPERLAANNHPIGGQSPVFRGGRPDLVIASLNPTLLQDDPRAAAMRRETLLCEQLSRSGSLEEIRQFEAECAYCRHLRQCASGLSARRTTLVNDDAACQAAQWRFDRAKTSKDVAVLRDLIEQNACAKVKSSAEALLAELTRPADPCAKDREALARLMPSPSRETLQTLLAAVSCPEVRADIGRRIDDIRLAAEKDRACQSARDILADIPASDLDSLRALRSRNTCEAIEPELSRRIQLALDAQLTCTVEQRRVGELERSADTNGLRDLIRSTRCMDVRRSAEVALERVIKQVADASRCESDKRQLASLSKARVEDLARLASASACSDVASSAREKWRSWLPAGGISAEAVQRALGWTGDLDAAFDGDFGPKSQTALASWQSRNSVHPSGDYGAMDEVDLARLIRDAERERERYGYAIRRDRHTEINWGLPSTLVPSSGTAETRADGTRVARYQASSGSPQITLLRGRGHVRYATGRLTLDMDPAFLKDDFKRAYNVEFECWWVKAERPYGAFCLGEDERRQLYVRYRVVNNELIGFIFRIDQTEPHLRALLAVFSDDWAKNNPMPY